MPTDDRRPFSSLEMAVVEANAFALGISLRDLMAAAGRAVAEEAALRLPPPPARVALIIGSGNNGGDGLAAAIARNSGGSLLPSDCVGPPSGSSTRLPPVSYRSTPAFPRSKSWPSSRW